MPEQMSETSDMNVVRERESLQTSQRSVNKLACRDKKA